MPSPAELIVEHICNLVDPGRRLSATDGQLLSRWALEKDSRAFAALVARHGPLVWRVGHNILQRTEDAEDIFQATFLILARKAARLQRHSSIAGWLYETAHRLALKARKASARRVQREARFHREPVGNPLDELSVREARLILGEEVERLPVIYREPILLCLYEGATHDEAARQLGYSVRTLQRRLERARHLLSRRLAQRGLAPASALALTLCVRSELPAALARKTVAAAMQFVSGSATTGAAVIIAEGALRAVTLKTVAVYMTLCVGIGGVTLAGLAVARDGAPSAKKAAPVPAVRAAAQAVAEKELEPRVDANGDLLPAGAVQRIGSNRFRHGGAIVSMAYTPDGKSIISTSSNGYVNCWDAGDGKLRWRTLFDKAGYDRPIAVSGDSKRIALLSGSKFAVLATETGKPIVEHSWPVPKKDAHFRYGAISPDLSTFAFSCQDATVRWYDASTGKEKGHIGAGDNALNQIPSALQFSSDGKAIYLTVADKPGVMVIEIRTGKVRETLKTARPLTEGCRLIVSAKRVAAVDSKRLFVWDLTPAKNHLHIERWYIGEFAGAVSSASANVGAFSPDNSIFACSAGKSIVLIDTASGDASCRLSGNFRVNSLVFSPDGKTLACGDGSSITLWSIANKEPTFPTSEPQGVRRVRFTTNGKEVISFGRALDWWDIVSDKSVRHLAPHSEWHNDPSVSPDGKLVAANGYSGVQIFDTATGAYIRMLSKHKPSPGQQGIFSSDGTAFWSGVTAFSPDGTKLFSADMSPRILIWDLVSGKQLRELPVPELLQNTYGSIANLAVSPDGRWLASAAWSTSNDPTRNDTLIWLWDVATGKLVHRLKGTRGLASAIIFSEDSSRLVSLSSMQFSTSGRVQLWDVASGSEVSGLASRPERISSIAMTPDSRMLATTSPNKGVHLWEVASGKERHQVLGHENDVFSMDFSPNGRLFAAASNDAPVYIWDAYSPPNLKLTNGNLAKQDREKLWQALADTDAAIAFQAICELIAHPSEAPAILEGGWKQLPRATPKRMRAWVADLNSDQFAARKTATTELERFAAAHQTLLRDALKQAGTLEARRRLEKILGRINPEGLRRSRMLEVLEQVHTAPARRFLQTLAEQTDDAAMAREAAAGLRRLDAQAKAPTGAERNMR